jgi:hypothetical protein
VRRWIALLPWAVPAISLAALPAVAGAVFAPAAGAATFRVAPSTARVPLSATATLPAVAVRELGGPRPLLGTRSKSPNWSGYDVTGGPFTSVTATWTQPRVRASGSFFTDTAFWVGLDGDSPDPVHDPPRTVEQIGTEGFSLQRVYYDAWYEMYPANYVRIPMAIHPGDVITASVTWAPAAPATDSSPAIQEGFTLALVNSTTNKSFATFQPTAKMSIPPERSSVEVIAEAPSLGDGSVLPLADFGLANFHGCAFDDQPISAFDWSRINMVSWDTNRTEAATSALSPDGTAFSVTTDLKRPVTTVSGAGARWYGKPVTLRFRAKDNRGGTGVAYTQYSLDRGSTWTKGRSVTVPAPSDHSADGATTIWYRSADRAGNLERKRSCVVHIDTRGPTPVAKWPARVVSGRQATLRYYVSDPRPGSLTATVTLRIRDSRGTLVKKFVLPGCRVDTMLAHRFVCLLARGSYRVVVSTTDAAGNASATTATSVLLVR